MVRIHMVFESTGLYTVQMVLEWVAVDGYFEVNESLWA